MLIHFILSLYAISVTDLQAKVEELKVNNEYQLKLKEMSYTEKIKSLTEKFTLEIELSRHKLEVNVVDDPNPLGYTPTY